MIKEKREREIIAMNQWEEGNSHKLISVTWL